MKTSYTYKNWTSYFRIKKNGRFFEVYELSGGHTVWLSVNPSERYFSHLEALKSLNEYSLDHYGDKVKQYKRRIRCK